ncbi:MAG: hypothetical protein H7259_02985 [Cytophagales bacterium]|nr:hypothetical protein [Cytophaga sp.]
MSTKSFFSQTLFLKGLTNYYIKSDFNVTINLADVEKLYPLNGKILKGEFSADLKAEGIYNKEKHQFPALDASVRLINGYVKTPDYPEPLENIHFIANARNKDGKPEDTRVTIEQFSYLLEGEPFSVNGYIEDFIKMKYDVKIKGVIDLEKLTKIYPLQGTQVKGVIDSDIEARGSIADLENGNYAKTSCSGTIEIEKLQYTSESLPSTITVSDALFRLSPSKVTMERFKGTLGKSDVSLTGDLTNYMYFVTSNNDVIKGDLVLTSDTLDLTEWIDATKPAAIGTTNTGTTTPSSTSTVWEVPKNVDFVFDSDLNTVLYEDVRINQMKGEITIKDGIMSLYETGFNTLDASFGVTGHYDTRDMKHPKFDCKLNINELDINKAYREVRLVRKLAPASGDTYGRVTVDYQIAGEVNSDGTAKMETLVGGGKVSIANAKINGMKMFDEISKSSKKQDVKDPHLKDFSITTTIHDNKLFVEPFELKVNGLNADIEGFNDINGGTVNYIVKIELIPIDKIRIPFHVTGTYDNPKVTMGKGKGDN